MSAAVVYFLYVISGASGLDLTALASFDSLETCKAAQAAVTETLSSGQEPQHVACVSSELLQKLAADNP